jgi:hypothetical protein
MARPKSIEARVARAEAMLGMLVNRCYGNVTKGHEELLKAAASEIAAEIDAGSHNFVISGGDAHVVEGEPPRT